MATSSSSVSSVTALLSSTQIGFIRPFRVKIVCKNVRPNQLVYAWFDDVEVTRHITQINGTNVKGDPIVSDNDGYIEAYFDIPGKTFTTGKKTFTLNEIPMRPEMVYYATDVVDPFHAQTQPVYKDDVSYTIAPGQVTGSASAEFTSTGVEETYQTTNTTTVVQIVRVEDHVPVRQGGQDPLAETFFTTGISDGVYISSIDLFFKDKDQTAPIWVEIRDTQAGLPLRTLVVPHATATVNAADVHISDDASVPTNFKFPKLVYLKPDGDYCMVITSMSNKYNAWTSKMGEASIETGKIVFTQPYVGSLMRSENNYTWTAEQHEDIKFVMKRAEFRTDVSSILNVPLHANSVANNSANFFTMMGTDKVYVGLNYRHGLSHRTGTSSKVGVTCDPDATYNGVAGNLMAGTFDVAEVLSEYIFSYNVGNSASFTSSAYITTGGRVTDIQVDAKGSNYNASNPPVVVITPVAGNTPSVPATATLVITTDGKIDYVKITEKGKGYTAPPVVTLDTSSAPGTGAVFTALINEKFTLTTNRIYTEVNPAMSMFIPSNTDVGCTLDTTLGEYPDGSTSSYTDGGVYPINLQQLNLLDNNLLIASRTNELNNMGGNNSALMNITFNSKNSTVSPIIDLNNSRMYMGGYVINQQTGSAVPKESLSASKPNGQVITGSATIVSGGHGYTDGTYNVIVFGTGSGATATATIASGTVTAVTITASGSRYMIAPKLILPTAAGSGTGFVATCDIDYYNSELDPYGGNALSRYFTKQTMLTNVSSGMRVFVNAYSNHTSSFELYVRTTLSGTGLAHKDAYWQMLDCDTTRNKSVKYGEFIEYEFKKDTMELFDSFSLKIIMRSATPWDPPIIRDYRAIALAN